MFLVDLVDFGKDRSFELVCFVRVCNLFQILNGDFEEFLNIFFYRLVETTTVGINKLRA